MANKEETLYAQTDEIAKKNRQLAESRALLDHFVKAYSSAYTVNLKEDSFKILHMNHAFQQVFSMNGERKDMERFIDEHVHPDDKEIVRRMTDNNYIRERLKNESEISFTIREEYDGNERTMHALIMRGTDPDHAAVGFMDVTEEIRKQREISEKLEAANRAKSAFLFNMSHDIRTPLNAIIGFTEMAIKYSSDPERVTDCLNKVRVSGEHLLSLINDVLDMARVESGKVTINEKPELIDTSVDHLFSMINGSAEEKGITIGTSIDSSVVHHWVYADRMQMIRVLMNVLSNSIKYTGFGGHIDLTISEIPSDRPDYALIRYTVSDNGVGMSKEFLSHLFEPFSRAENSTKSGIVGTGLGMAITQSLVTLMGGKISVESTPDVGTTVTVDISHRIAEPVETKKAVIGMDPGILKDKKVLLVEDNELNREIAADILSEAGMIVDTANDGDIAVEMMKEALPGQFDLVLMDIQMPNMNGYDATRAIRALPDGKIAGIPIIAMTANAFYEDKQNAFAAGMDGHVSKPIDIPVLIRTISDVLDKRNKRNF